MGLVDIDKTKMAWIQGWQDDGTDQMHFYIEFWCPLCYDNTDDEKLVVYFDYQYSANVGTSKSRSAVCKKCKHAFVILGNDILYARQKVRNLKRLNYVRQKLYPCQYAHSPAFCEDESCAGTFT